MNSDGSPKWWYPTGGSVGLDSPAIASDGTVYVISDHSLYAINPQGALKWKYLTGDRIEASSPAIAPDGTIYIGSYDKYLYAINPDGALKWKYLTGGEILRSSPAIAPDGTVYVGSADYYFYAINQDGTLKWKYQTDSCVTASPAIASDGTVYVGSLDQYIYAINQDGTLKWKYHTGGSIEFESPAIAPDGTIYAGSNDKYLYAINPDGTLKWKYLADSSIKSSTAITSEGIIYVGSDDGHLYAIKPDGSLKWKYKTISDATSSPAIASDGTVYIGSEDKYLYAFGNLALTSPNSGESWTTGSLQNITWKSSGITNVKLEYSVNNGSTWTTIVDSTSAATESYPWTAPSVSSVQCLVKVSDASNSIVTDRSDGVFTILGLLALTSPNGGESWTAGTSQSIMWTSTGITSVKLEYSVTNDSTWTTIVASTGAAAGSYSWMAPNVSSTQCRVRISDVSNTTIHDQSNTVFTIIGNVAVTSPNGGEFWIAGTTQNITWTSTGVTNVKLEYSPDNGWNWLEITASTKAISGSYSWFIPSMSTITSCRVRISDALYTTLSDISDGEFTILPQMVTLTSPNGSESWTVGTTNNITWISNVSTVKLEYTTNNGLTWTTIVESTEASTGSYAWTAPAISSMQCKVRISDASNASVNDESNSLFSLLGTMAVIAPNGGENWTVGTTHNITWLSIGVTNVTLQYSVNKGSTWITIAASTAAATGSYSWTVPGIPGVNCLVRVSDTSNPAVNDQTDSVFSILATITLKSPNGGEQWISGTTQTITWTSVAVDTVKIEYAPDGVNWSNLTPATVSSGSYLWYIPAYYTTSKGKIRITDIKNSSITDQSDDTFSITPPAAITVTAPNGGESWASGTTHNITWSSTDVSNIKIEYSTNNGSTWTTITASTNAAAGRYVWTVTNTSSTTCLVRVSNLTGLPVSDQSDATFTILPVTLDMTSPNGGERWIAGKTYPVTWTQQNVSNVKLEYSANSGESWNLISASVSASAGSYAWTIPDANSTVCLVKATDTSNMAVRDSSNAVFTIARPAVAVTAPNGGEVWTAGSQRTITWTSTDVDSIKVEYSTNGGSAWTMITDGMPASGGSLTWTVPNVNSTKCLVRVTNRTGLAVNDPSNSIFTIIPVTVTLISPNGGESLIAEESHTITWVSSGITNVKLEYTPDGITWVEIASNLNAAIGSYTWSIPLVISTKCIVRITNAADLTVTDRSDFPFSIINPFISLTSPNGGEQWAARRTLSITWEAIGIPLAKLEYSIDNGNTWELLADNIDTTALSYSWKVPETLSAKCLVRITDMAKTSRSDISDDVFTIAPPPTMQITAPNGGENWRCTETKNITWTSEGIDSLHIEYTLNGGQIWKTLAPSVPAIAGIYQWTLPDETSSQSLIRITDVSDTTFTDSSDAPFNIFRYNLSADFTVDTDIITSGNQGVDHIELIGGGKNIGFALYAKEWETAGGITVTLSWNSEKVSIRSASSPNIIDEEKTINGKTFTPAPETNILGEGLLTAGEQNTPGLYTRSFAVRGESATVDPDGLIYFAMFRTATAFAEGDTLSIRCSVLLADRNGMVKDLGARFFRVLPGMQPPLNLTVSDVPNDQGHSLNLSWIASPSETSGAVSYYRIYRSLTNALSDSIKPMSLFADIRDVTDWERHAAVLVDSVAAGMTGYTDTAVGLAGVPYYYWIQAVGAGGESEKVAAGSPVMIKEQTAIPAGFRLGEARPNPFNPSTTIEYSLSRTTRVILRVYNVSGRKVATLTDGTVSAGDHFAVWNAAGMPSGVYFYTLSAEGGRSETKKALLLK